MLTVSTNTPFSRTDAETVLAAWLGRPVHCTAQTPLTGGMLNAVFEIRFDADPGVAVVKVSSKPGAFTRERAVLDWLRGELRATAPSLFPQPWFEDSAQETLDGRSVLVMERLPGTAVSNVFLSPEERALLDRDLAVFLANALHAHTAPDYGDVCGETRHGDWVDAFLPRMIDMRRSVEDKADPVLLHDVDGILEAVPELLSPAGPPTLVHGDIWAGNILVDRMGGAYRFSGLVDPGALHADVEYELAYLDCFDTVGEAFFEVYDAVRPRRPGYATRRHVYALQTMLIHIRLFGDAEYHDRARREAEILRTALGRA